MALRIANNIAAMNTQRWLGISDNGMKKSLERLSSGYRINKAADDAAGLAISQAFRANIASFGVASRNASEAAALLQVAEGGMDQIGNMLTRLKELATQASSANAGSSEREKIDAEADQLIIEIDRISASTKYGSTALLDGNFGVSQTTALSAGVTASDERASDIVDTNVIYDLVFTATTLMSGASVTALGDSVAEDVTYYLAITAADATTVYLANSAGTSAEKAVMGAASTTIEFINLGITIDLGAELLSDTGIQIVGGAATTFVGSDSGTSVEFTRTGLTSLTANNAATGTYTFGMDGDDIQLTGPTMTQSVAYVGVGQTLTFDELNITFNLSSDFDTSDLTGMTFVVDTNADAAGSTFQIGSENNTDNQISIAVDGVSTTTLGINTVDLSSTSGAQSALTTIDAAISTLAGSRGDIGAFMNRLSYASANLATTIENIQAAESVIRDVDMASEMTTFTKNQILLQAGTAMLAQANMAPQQVLALFG